jgi:hypothetical protein
MMLHEVQRLATSGARAVEPFTHEGAVYLAVPQLAADIPGQPPALTVGNSDVETLVFRWERGAFVEHQRLKVPGGEDAEFFAIGERRFLATASLRSGSGPYRMDPPSEIFELRAGRFEPFQSVPGKAAKQWRHFRLGDRHFLALAQGVVLGPPGAPNPKSCIFEWNGERFAHFQDVASAWGYNWEFMEVGNVALLAYADHVEPSRLLRWTGKSFERFQDLQGRSGRAFCHFRAAGESWLAFANLHDDSLLYRWSGDGFVLHQKLSGPGGREFEWIADGEAGHLVQVNFIHGTREAPQPVLQSVVYAWRGKAFEVAESFDTTGGTDAAAFDADGVRYLAVSNSLDESLRFRADTRIYRFTPR